jgi:quercetin dioxygenase-like cupin family protein
VGFRIRQGDAPNGRAAGERFAAWGLQPRSWGNGPGDTYGWHDHAYHKVLYCVRGSITFHDRGGTDVELRPGDRLDVEPGTEHAATVGPDGVECIEASADGPPEERG